jgi:hypothetical protein
MASSSEAAMTDVVWDIRRQGRAWHGDEARERWALTPERFEMADGKLFFSEADRLALLALLLENVGADAAVRLGDPLVWMEAVSGLLGWPFADRRSLDFAVPVDSAQLPAEARTCAAILARVMGDLSQDYWCAGWLIDLEYDLWAAVRGEQNPFTTAELAELKYLSHKCGGWIVWHDEKPWRRFVLLPEWERMFESRREQRAERSGDDE